MFTRISIVLALTVVVFFTLTASGTADEDISTGNYIVDGCNAFAELMSGKMMTDTVKVKAAECMGAIHAVAFSGSVLRKVLCIPEDVTYGQMGKVVAKYMHDHLDHLNWDYAALIYSALHDAWPCPAGTSK